MNRTHPLVHLALLLLVAALPSALAVIGEEPAAILDALAARGVVVTSVDGGYLGLMGTADEPGVRFTFDERGGAVYRVEGSARVGAVAGDPAAAFVAELIGASTSYGDQLVEPVRTFFETRLGELVGQGTVSLGVEEYVLTLTVERAALEIDGPYQVDFALALLEIDESRFPAADHAIGPEDARFVIREFSDFQCPFCANFQRVLLPQILAAIERGEGIWSDVRFEFHHFPLRSIHANAVLAAEAAECVTAANDPADFWLYHDALYEEQVAWQGLGDPSSYFVRLARELGLESEGVGDCLAERDFFASIENAYSVAAAELRLTGTPTLFVDGFKVVDYLSLEAYETLMERSERFAQP